MFSSVLSATVAGVDCIPITIEADVSQGLPMFSMVGYLSARVKEAQERVRTALRNTGLLQPFYVPLVIWNRKKLRKYVWQEN